MDVSGHDTRIDGHNPITDAAEEVRAVFRGGDLFGRAITIRNVAMVVAIVASAAVAAAARFYGVPTNLVLTQPMATENALTYYSTIAGIGGFVGSIIASNRLAGVEGDTVTVAQMATPMAVTAAGNFAAGFLFPSG